MTKQKLTVVLLVSFLGFASLMVVLQIGGGAWRSEFAGHPDEAAHYVTGLMMRDYLATAAGKNPMRFANDYYAHYPKVALGHWPPVFYLMQSAWTLPFGVSRPSVLLLMATITAACATLIVAVGWRGLGLPLPWAVAAALTFCLLPLVQAYTGMVMTEPAIALWCLAAAAAFGRFLRTGHWRDSVLFGLLASAAILTKGTGFMLALVPPLAILFSRRWALLKDWRLWAAAAVVVVICGPWTVLTMKMVQNGWEEGRPSIGFVRSAVPYYLWKLILSAGPVVLAAAAWGAFQNRRSRNPLAASLAALTVGGMLFHFVMPCGHEARHLVPLLAPVMLAAVIGCRALPRPQLTVPVVAIVAIVITVRISEKDWQGFRSAAAVVQASATSSQIILIASDARGEGAFIAEMAMADHKRPEWTVARSSKLFAASGWSGADYKATAETPEAMIDVVRKANVKLLVVDSGLKAERRTQHVGMLAETVAAHPEIFEAQGTVALVRNGESTPDGLRIYRLVEAAADTR